MLGTAPAVSGPFRPRLRQGVAIETPRLSRQLCRASQDSGRDRVTSRPKRLDADFISQFLAPLRDQASAISSISTSNPLNQRLSGDHTARVSPEALTHPEESEMLELSGHKRARPMIGKHAEFIVELVKFAEMQVEAAAAAEAALPDFTARTLTARAELAIMTDAAVRSGIGRPMSVPLRVPVFDIPDPFAPTTTPLEESSPNGDGEEVMLQGFNWESHNSNWYQVICDQAKEFADAGFSMVWLPPPTDSVSPHGYMPRDLYCLDSCYGSEQQLRDCIQTLQSHGIKVIGDVVLNHRCAHYQDENGVWNKFGGKLDWDQRAIVRDDPHFGGQGNHSTGDCFHAAPNIDHQQEFVRKDISEWMKWLRNDIGFDGWRLDFARGFDGRFVGEYIDASLPEFVVGEFWDSLSYNNQGTAEHNQNSHRQRIVNWINATGGKATAFDVTTKGILHAVFERNEFWRLKDHDGKPPGVMGWWPSRTTTFIENHDTGSTQGHWRFPEHAVEQGYVYILTHPGTPTVFYDHFHQHNLKERIKSLIALRRRHRLSSRSSVEIHCADRDVYAAEIDEKVLVKIGPGEWSPDYDLKGHKRDASWMKVEKGHNWCIWEHESDCSLTTPHHH